MAEAYQNLHPEMIKSLIPVYDNKTMTVTNFIARIAQFAVVYGWSHEQKFLYASTRLDGVPKMWYNSTCSKINNWKQFADSIKTKFDSSVDTMDVRFKLKKHGSVHLCFNDHRFFETKILKIN